MAYLNLSKACPKCGTAISGWHARLLSKDHAIVDTSLADAPHKKITWGPFACTACGAKLVLTCDDSHLVHKLAGAVFVSIVAGFILGYFIGWGGCFSCDMLLIGLLIALNAAWIVARSIKVGVVKTASVFVSDRAP
jgi:hypothetical protein